MLEALKERNHILVDVLVGVDRPNKVEVAVSRDALDAGLGRQGCNQCLYVGRVSKLEKIKGISIELIHLRGIERRTSSAPPT